MGLKLQKTKSLPIGVDLGSSSLRMAQLRASEGGFDLVAAACADMPRASRFDSRQRLGFQREAIRKALKSRLFKGRSAMLSIPAAGTFLQPVKVVPGVEKDLDTAVTNQLHDKLPWPVRDAVIRHMPAATLYGDEGRMEERIVVAIARSEVEKYLRMAAHAGLDVAGVSVEACAIAQCFARVLRRTSDEDRLLLFVDMGSSSTQVVVNQGRKMVFAHNLAVGGKTLEEEIAKKMGIPEESARSIRRTMGAGAAPPAAEDELYRLLDGKINEMAQEISKCLRYCESLMGGKTVESVVFVGGHGHDKRMCQAIAERLGLPAKVGDPMVGLRWPGPTCNPAGLDARAPQPAWAVAVGLSLGGMEN